VAVTRRVHHPFKSLFAVKKPVQWMTLAELRDELVRTRPAWETVDLDHVLATGQLAALSDEAQRHHLVAKELIQRPISS